ncbi:MAG: pyridoxamine 5'-phosphate oxidase family protein [Actinomycetota bacterium]|nr:pyridoxamine 5'-phosphate oxidase family protein [Actinomycetota bacterium]
MATHGSTPTARCGSSPTPTANKVRDIAYSAQVSLGTRTPGSNTSGSVAGTARLVKDRERKRALWSAPLKVFVPDGAEDPNVTLVRVDPHEAEVWDGPSTTVGRLVAFAKTYASNATEPPGNDVVLDLGGRAP